MEQPCLQCKQHDNLLLIRRSYIWKDTLYAASCGDVRGFMFSCPVSEGSKIIEFGDNKTTRGLGSILFKEQQSHVVYETENQLISAVPHVNVWQLNSDIRFIILGTWTFWSALESKGNAAETVFMYIQNRLVERQSDQNLASYLNDICAELIIQASQPNEQENISCLITVFDHLSDALIY